MTMKKNKKGIFFTMAAIALALVLLLSLQTQNTREFQDQADVVSVRILAMNSFVKDVEQDLSKGLGIAGFRAIASINEIIALNGTYIASLDTGFSELLLQGTIEGQQPSLMQYSTFTDWADKIETQANKLGINVNFTIISVQLNQTNPWEVEIRAIINITLNDTKGTSSWKRQRTIMAPVKIIGFEDPLYLVGTSGKVTNTVIPSPIIQFVINGDVTNLLEHANASYYRASASAPNYLQRMQGLFANSSNGIESLVNVGELDDQGVSIKDRSIVDYIYFGTKTTVNYRINNTPSWFKIDQGHLLFYEVENITI